MTTDTENPNNIQCGDSVQWMRTARSGRAGLSFTTKRGKVAGKDSTHAVVRTQAGKLVKIALTELTPASQPSPVNKVLTALTGA